MKRPLLLMATVILSLGLAGCGDGADNPANHYCDGAGDQPCDYEPPDGFDQW